MIILHVITTLDRGGAENHLADLATLQASLGHKVYIAYLQGRGDWVPHLNQSGIRCIPLYGSSRALRPLLASSLRLRNCIVEINPDVLHAHMPPAEIVAWLAVVSSFSRAKFIISKHVDSSFFRGSEQRKEVLVGKIAASVMMLRASRVIAISISVSRYLQSNYVLFGRSKVKVIYYGIDSARFSMLSCSSHSGASVNPSVITVGTAARLVPQKCIDVLLRAFACLAGLPALNIRLLIAGDGPLRNELQELTSLLRIESYVHWLGQISDIESFMHDLDIFVLPSMYEGLGLVLLEAMASSLPVVASDASAIPEIVEDGQTGILFPVGSHELLSEGIRFLALNSSVRRRMGMRGLARVNDRFTLLGMVEETMAVYS